MYVRTDTTTLKRAFNAVKAAAPRRKFEAMGVLNHVRIDVAGGNASLTCTDFDLAATAVIEDAEVGDGEAVAFVEKTQFNKMLTKTPKGPVTLIVEEVNEVTVETESSLRITLRSSGIVQAYDSPKIFNPDAEQGAGFGLDVDAFKRCAAVASTDDSRPQLQKVCIEPDGTYVATDSYGLAYEDTGIESGVRVTVSPRVARHLPAADQIVEVTYAEGAARFKFGSGQVVCRADDEFLNWVRLIEDCEGPQRIQVARKELSDAITQVSGFDDNGYVVLCWGAEGLRVQTRDEQTSTLVDARRTTGFEDEEWAPIMFDGAFLVRALKLIESDYVEIVHNKNKAALITGPYPCRSKQLLMPVKMM